MIDLYLGSDLGLWVLKQISGKLINRVFTSDVEIARTTRDMKLKVCTQNPNQIEFENSATGFSIHYPKIFKPHIIAKYQKIYNLHPAFLPWGRGYYPIFWALWENTPAGATLHEINEGIDQGNIVAQIQVDYDDSDTGGSLFRRVREAEKKLFLQYWEKIIAGETLPSYPQTGKGSYHNRNEFRNLKEHSNWENMSSKNLIKLIKCFTFDGYSGLELIVNQKKFEAVLKPLDN